MTDEWAARRVQERELQVAIGRRMRWARNLVEPNLSAFARELGVQPPVVTKIETGEQGASAMVLREYALRLGITVDYMIFGRLQAQPMDYEMQLRLLSEHPELLGMQRAADNLLGKGKVVLS